MKNLLNFFFSFDKLFKEKLVVPFFWLAIIFFGIEILIEAVDAVQLEPLLWIIVPVFGLVKILFTLVSIRIVAELIVAGFRINDNLSPDGGKSELADIDPVAEARKAAELAAAKTREATKKMRENVGEMSENVQGKAKAATASVREKADDFKAKTRSDKALEAVEDIEPKPATKATPTEKAKAVPEKSTASSTKKPATKKPATKKPMVKKPAAKKTTSTSTGKRGPKVGTKIPRDADGNLLKKDGTPRKKPGPKK